MKQERSKMQKLIFLKFVARIVKVTKVASVFPYIHGTMITFQNRALIIIQPVMSLMNFMFMDSNGCHRE